MTKLPFLPVQEEWGVVLKFRPAEELKRAALIEEARANYERIFPTEKPPIG